MVQSQAPAMDATRVTLRPVALSWVQGPADDPADLCAHGHVEFRIDDALLVDPMTGPNVTVSAAGLYLLRTLSRSHTKAQPVGDHLFPHCGFAMFSVADQEDVVVTGCVSGVDFEIIHGEQDSALLVRTERGQEFSLPRPAWTEAVHRFADLVAEFYRASAPKRPFDDLERAGFLSFSKEWERRRGRPLVSSGP